MEKVIRRGYVKWTDEDGVFHKEPLADHPELLAKATDQEQLAAEEARRLNEAGQKAIEEAEAVGEDNAKDTLEALKKAPDEILTAAQLTADTSAPDSAPEDDGKKSPEVETLQSPAASDPGEATTTPEHDNGLAELREATAS